MYIANQTPINKDQLASIYNEHIYYENSTRHKLFSRRVHLYTNYFKLLRIDTPDYKRISQVVSPEAVERAKIMITIYSVYKTCLKKSRVQRCVYEKYLNFYRRKRCILQHNISCSIHPHILFRVLFDATTRQSAQHLGGRSLGTHHLGQDRSIGAIWIP